MRMKRLRFWNCLILIIASLMFALPAGHTEAARQKVNIQVEPGWKGEYKGEFVPVRIQLVSSGGYVSGEVSVELPNQKWSQQKPDIYPLEKVELLAGASKEITLIVPNELARPDAVVVFKAGQEVLGSHIVGGRRLGTNDLTIGVLSDDSHSAGPLLKAVAGDAKNAVHTYPLNAKEVPNQGRALSGLDVLVINRLASESLTPAQIRAIHLWVDHGGKLLIGGGNQASATVRGLESLLPVELTGKTVSVSDLGSFSLWGTPPKGPLAISQSKLKEGSQSLAASGGEILLAHRDLGQGKVFYAGYDLASEPLVEWPGNEKLWSQELLFAVLGQNHPQGGGTGIFQDLWGLRTALNQMPHFRLPKMSTLIVVFAIYLLVVGPIIYWVFARMKKHEWNWLAVPLIGILATLGLFLYGNQLRGNAVLVHNIGIVHADDNGSATVHGAAAIVSQEADDYELMLAGGFAWPLKFEFSRQPSGENRVSFQNGASIHYMDVPQWSKRDAYVEQVTQIGGNLTGTVTRQNHQLVGEVKNGTRLKLKQVRVIMGNSTLLIGDLAPGASKRFTAPNSLNWQTRLQPEQMGLKGRELELYRQLLVNPGLMSVSQLDVIGWTEEPLLHMRVKDRKINESNLYLVNGTISMKADETGKLTLPFGMIPSRVIDSSYPIYGDGYAGTIAMENSGTITFEYVLDPYMFAQIDRLEVKTASGAEEIYDWQRGQWHPVSAMNPKSPSGYLSPDQRVRVRIKVQAHQMTGKPMIEVEGRAKK